MNNVSDVSRDQRWMRHALSLAERARKEGEVPVGAVLVNEDEMVAEGWNQPISHHDPTAHAEIVALRAATLRLGNYRLPPGISLYVTLEPCPMCAGALVHARLSRVVFGAPDPRTGAGGSVFNLLDCDKLNHRAEVVRGVLEAECAEVLKGFFKARR
jgi:tRNA(adenine34) deaminase